MTTYEIKSKKRKEAVERGPCVREAVERGPSVSGYTHVLCCPCCEFCTLSSLKLQQHAERHGPETLSSYSTYTCLQCMSTSTEKVLMEEHVSLYHEREQARNVVELREEVHTIVRKKEEPCLRKSVETKQTLMRTKSRRSEVRVERNLKKIKWKSRIKKIKSFALSRWQNKELLKDCVSSSKDIEEYYKQCGKEEDIVVDEPLDMTIKTQQKLEAFNNNESPDDKPAAASSTYPALYNNLKCHLLDMFSKSPLTASISNPLLMRYFSSHLHSITGNKYFPNDMFLPRSLHQPENRLPTTNDALYHHNDQDQRIQIPLCKFQSSNNSSSGTPHRSLHRNNFTPFQNHILLEWYDKHKNKPYPSTEDTKHLSTLCGLSYPQVKKWFANKRARSTFYQKNDLISCDEDLRCDMLRFPLRITSRMNVDIVRSMEAEFRKTLGNKMPNLV